MDDDKDKAVPKYGGAWWIKQIDAFEKNAKEEFWDSGATIIKRYLDKSVDDDPLSAKATKKYNIFWANVQILKSALYATPPKPVVTREYGDSKDDVGRVAALILERILQQDMSKSRSDAHEAVKACVEDRLLPGLGQVWVRYDATISEELQETEFGPVAVPIIKKERVLTDYVNWRDFMWSPCRKWEECWWVGRRVWMRKDRFLKRFGPEKKGIWDDIKGAAEEASMKGLTDKGFVQGRAELFEIWCIHTKKVYFVARGCEEVIERIADPLELEDFWPCPPPLLATHSNESLFPRADYSMVQDQYEELDLLNTRIVSLTKALRVVGAYDKNNSELAKMITGNELDMIPVENWAVLGENGGMQRAVEWFPVEQVANVLKELIPQRATVVAQIYELTSISDIMRGASNPRETLGAQQLKAQYSSVRLQLTQGEVATFAQNMLRIRAEVICRHMQPETIKRMSQIEFTESAQFADQAIALLKDFEQSEYRIDVSEESLSMADYNAEREMRVELITAIGQFFSQSSQMLQGTPQALPYVLRMVQWVIAAFKGSKDIESVMDEAITAAQNAPPPGQEQEKPDHSIEVANIKAKADIDVANIKATTDKEVEGMKLGQSATLEREKLQEKTLQDDLNRVAEEDRARAERERTMAIESQRTAATQPAADLEPVHQTLAETSARLEGLEDGMTKMQELLEKVLKATSQTRRRIPRRNAEGDIIAVDEEIIGE